MNVEILDLSTAASARKAAEEGVRLMDRTARALWELETTLGLAHRVDLPIDLRVMEIERALNVAEGR